MEKYFIKVLEAYNEKLKNWNDINKIKGYVKLIYDIILKDIEANSGGGTPQVESFKNLERQCIQETKTPAKTPAKTQESKVQEPVAIPNDYYLK